LGIFGGGGKNRPDNKIGIVRGASPEGPSNKRGKIPPRSSKKPSAIKINKGAGKNLKKKTTSYPPRKITTTTEKKGEEKDWADQPGQGKKKLFDGKRGRVGRTRWESTRWGKGQTVSVSFKKNPFYPKASRGRWVTLETSEVAPPGRQEKALQKEKPPHHLTSYRWPGRGKGKKNQGKSGTTTSNS